MYKCKHVFSFTGTIFAIIRVRAIFYFLACPRVKELQTLNQIKIIKSATKKNLFLKKNNQKGLLTVHLSLNVIVIFN